MGDIKIVEYDKAYAKSLADMWNMSADSWGNSGSIYTEESVIEENENTGNLNIYIALDGDEVVGYCSFSEYREDEGALYIPLLNVRPDYHGKKVGKALVLQAVKRTIELGWPRLDLYTWPGNTKAVPLYKKCGFFWEKRDDSTHLMNFIPTVLQTEAVQEFFEAFDWYQDCKRNIDVKPDGSEEDNFSNYEYIWEKDGKHLRMAFDRKGRGLRLIETDDYLISADIQEQELVFGKEYNISYNIVNKTGNKLDIAINGKDDKNIKFSFETVSSVEDKKTVTARFFVDAIEEEQNHWRTHPCVTADITINGKSAVFKVGINPKFPAKISLSAPNTHKLKNMNSEFYIDIENSFKEEAVFQFVLPESDNIIIQNRSFNVTLAAQEKASIAVPYILNKPFSYEATLSIKASLSNNFVEFKRKISLQFSGYDGRFGGETDEYWCVFNGNYSLQLTKFNNDLILKRIPETRHEVVVFYPKIGLPFSLEFSKERPYTVENYCGEDYIALKAFYKSRDFKHIQIVSISKLYANGLVEHSYEVHNTSDVDADAEVWLSQSYYYGLADAVIPYEDKYIEIDGEDSSGLEFWDSSKITENWIFSSEKSATIGLCWPEKDKIKFNGWYLSIEKNLGKIPAHANICTEPCYMAIDTFKDWKELRKFALKDNCQDRSRLSTTDKLELNINNGNPFVGNGFDVKIKDYRKSYFDGKMKLSSTKESFKELEKKFSVTDQINETVFSVNGGNIPKIDTLSLDIDFDAVLLQKKSAVFKINENVIFKKNKNMEKGIETLSLDNGEITIKTSPQFSNTIHSLLYKSKEWLDTSFPSSRPKSWWNPWFGGIATLPDEMTNRSFNEEDREADFVQLKDSVGNTWSGIVIKTNIKKNEKLKGLKIAQYYLMLPGVPVLCQTTEIVQETGYYFSSMPFMTDMYFKLDDEYKNNMVTIETLSGQLTTYKAVKDYEMKTKGTLFFSSVNREDKLMVYNNGDIPAGCFTNSEVIGAYIINKMDIKNNERIFLPPSFLIFTKEVMNHDLFKVLKNIKF
ncbi:GCN5-related N-acetyltransferase [Proteiniborus sp. DW1]|uniref:GNAT family N-acetyltransferase n=1 Tax=Proteiniborus sp. DW1 TaxID=1889883 RepID=UPI00092DF3DF|nr:GNAT family N-acetyltransferase [Proteiniborus sp. DW1]SCG82278.1 GCN5-related N-acetyltransferase [Proteiniborus sp. DW1]